MRKWQFARACKTIVAKLDDAMLLVSFKVRRLQFVQNDDDANSLKRSTKSTSRAFALRRAKAFTNRMGPRLRMGRFAIFNRIPLSLNPGPLSTSLHLKTNGKSSVA